DLGEAKVQLARARYQALKAGLAEKEQQQSPGKEQLKVAEAEIKTAEAQLRLAKFDRDADQIRAPSDGTVLARRVQVGQVVGEKRSKDSRRVLFELADLRWLEVVVEVPESLVNQVFPGQRCRIKAASIPKAVYPGKVLRVSPVVDSASTPFRTYVEIQLPERG